MEDAGIILAEELKTYRNDDSIVFGITGNGSIMARIIGRILNRPWSTIVLRRIASPVEEGMYIGAVTQDGRFLINENLLQNMKVAMEYIEKCIQGALQEFSRGGIINRQHNDLTQLAGKTALLVDDGSVTGYTISAAINYVKHCGASRTIAAVPAASVEAVATLINYADEVICVEVLKELKHVEEIYADFYDTCGSTIDLFKVMDCGKRLC
jgi:putative phosphoribosyl transferase